MVGDLSHSSYSTIEATLLEFVTHTLSPYIIMCEEEMTRKLIKPSEKYLYINLDENFKLKSDKQSQANYLNTLVSGGIITVNEARGILGFNKMDQADKLIIPYSDIDQNTINKPDNNNEKEEEKTS
jgi:phage portal protein BeeE